MDPTTSRVYLSRNVVFDETCFPAKEKITTSLPANTSSSSFGKVLPPSHFFSINSIPTTHTHDTTEPTASPLPIASPHNPASSPPSIDPYLSPHSALETSSPLQPPTLFSFVAPAASVDPVVPATDAAPTAPTTDAAPTASDVPAPSSSSLPTLDIVPHTSQRVTRSQTGMLKPKTFPDFHLYNATKHPLHTFCCQHPPL